jgi:hypothetical protein
MESLGTSLPPFTHASVAADIALLCDGSSVMHLHRLPLELDERLVLGDVGQPGRVYNPFFLTFFNLHLVACVAAVAHDGRTSIFAGRTNQRTDQPRREKDFKPSKRLYCLSIV